MTIQFSGQFHKTHVPFLGQPQLLYTLLEARPGAAVSQGRLPLNVSLVLDKSGSMYGDEMAQLQAAVHWIIDQLQPEDTIAIIGFDNRTQVLVGATPAADKQPLHDAVERLKASGGTTMGPAIEAGLAEIALNQGPGRISRLIVLTDGETTGINYCREQADAAGRQEVPLVALGLGKDWNENLLEDLAQRSGSLGYADLIKGPADMAHIFQEVFSRMQVVAQELALRLLLVQGVEARKVWQVAPLIRDLSRPAVQGRTVAIDVGDLDEGGVAFLVELMMPGREPGRYRLAQAELSYTLANQPQEPTRQRVDLLVEVTTDPTAALQKESRVMNIVEKVTAHKLQTQALADAAQGNIAAATQKLRAAHTVLLDQGETALAQNALDEAERLAKGEGVSNEGRKTMILQSRKTIRLSDPDA